MREYETIYIIKSDLSGDVVTSIKDKLANVLQKSQSPILCHADWGKRRLAYNIQKLRQGQYFYLQYLAKGPEVSEIERLLKLDDRVLRFLTVQLQQQVDVDARLANPIEAPLPPEEFYQAASSDNYYSRRGPSNYDDNGSLNENVPDLSGEANEE